MSTNQESFLKLGIYLLLQQVKIVTYRCLVKKIFNLCGCNSRMSLLTICDILQVFQYKEDMTSGTISGSGSGNGNDVNSNQWMDIEIDIDEVECILSNLIYSNKVKGYISHAKSILVLSKLDPFPFNSINNQSNTNSNSNNATKTIFSFNK